MGICDRPCSCIQHMQMQPAAPVVPQGTAAAAAWWEAACQLLPAPCAPSLGQTRPGGRPQRSNVMQHHQTVARHGFCFLIARQTITFRVGTGATSKAQQSANIRVIIQCGKSGYQVLPTVLSPFLKSRFTYMHCRCLLHSTTHSRQSCTSN